MQHTRPTTTETLTEWIHPYITTRRQFRHINEQIEKLSEVESRVVNWPHLTSLHSGVAVAVVTVTGVVLVQT